MLTMPVLRSICCCSCVLLSYNYGLFPNRSVGASIDHVPRHNLGLEAKELRIGGIDRDTDPVAIRPAEGFHAREILEQAIGLLAVERLVDAKDMGVAMQEGDRPVVAFQFFGQRLDVVVECQRPARRGLPARNEAKQVAGLGARRPERLKTRI